MRLLAELGAELCGGLWWNDDVNFSCVYLFFLLWFHLVAIWENSCPGTSAESLLKELPGWDSLAQWMRRSWNNHRGSWIEDWTW